MATSTSRRRPAAAKPLTPPSLVHNGPDAADAPAASASAQPPAQATELSGAIAELATEPPGDDLLTGALAAAELEPAKAEPLAVEAAAWPAEALPPPASSVQAAWSLPLVDGGAWLQRARQWRSLQEQAVSQALAAGREAARQLQAARDFGEVARIQAEWLQAGVAVSLQYWRGLAEVGRATA